MNGMLLRWRNARGVRRASVGAGVTARLLRGCALSLTGRSPLRLIFASQMTRMGVTACRQVREKAPGLADVSVNRYVRSIASTGES